MWRIKWQTEKDKGRYCQVLMYCFAVGQIKLNQTKSSQEPSQSSKRKRKGKRGMKMRLHTRKENRYMNYAHAYTLHITYRMHMYRFLRRTHVKHTLFHECYGCWLLVVGYLLWERLMWKYLGNCDLPCTCLWPRWACRHCRPWASSELAPTGRKHI